MSGISWKSNQKPMSIAISNIYMHITCLMLFILKLFWYIYIGASISDLSFLKIFSISLIGSFAFHVRHSDVTCCDVNQPFSHM